MATATLAARVSDKTIAIRMASDFSAGAIAPPPVAAVCETIESLAEVFDWTMEHFAYEKGSLRLCLREARAGSLHIDLEVVALAGAVVTTLSGQVPTAIANFMAMLGALQALKFSVDKYARTVWGERPRKEEAASLAELSGIVDGLGQSIKKVGRIELRTRDHTLILEDTEFRKTPLATKFV